VIGVTRLAATPVLRATDPPGPEAIEPAGTNEHTSVRGGVRAQTRALVAGLVLLVLLVAATSIAGALFAAHTANDVTKRLEPASDANSQILQSLTDAETGIRGWLVTDDRTFLRPYRHGMRSLAASEKKLARLLTTADPGLQRLVGAQQAAAGDWVESYARPSVAERGDSSSVGAEEFMLEKTKFDRLRAVNAQIDDRVDAMISHARKTAINEVRWAVVAAALVALLGAAVGLFFGRRTAHRISEPLVQMLGVVDRLATGDSTARAVPSGPREVRKVAHALNSFAEENERVRELEQQVVGRLTQLDQAKTDFLSNVSHELRTPLTSIAGYIELFEDDFVGEASPRQAAMLSVVKRNVARLQGLIENLLSLSKAQSAAFATTFDVLDLTHLASDAAHDLGPMAAERGITIRETHPRSLVIRGDAEQLSRALLNLMSNALKFSHEGTEVAIRLQQHDDWAHLEVTDHGMGIPEGEVRQLATRFFRASNAVDAEIGGTGLGLRIVQTIVSNHGGRLEIESVLGEGTTARMVLPVGRPADGKKTGVSTVDTSERMNGPDAD
jgi:signal transduction histidine kinase